MLGEWSNCEVTSSQSHLYPLYPISIVCFVLLFSSSSSRLEFDLDFNFWGYK